MANRKRVSRINNSISSNNNQSKFITNLAAVIAGVGLIGGVILFHPETTGNVIADVPVQTSNAIGVIAMCIGLLAAVMYSHRKH